jgi:steroid delta-isomerase-like uncharacterized protein
MTAQDSLTVARRMYELYNRHTSDPTWLEEAAALVEEDAEQLDVPSGTILRGPEGMKQFLSAWARAFPDSTIEIRSMVASGDQVVTEFIGRGTHTGPLRSAAGEIPPTGQKLVLRFCDVVTLHNGNIAQVHTYYDALSMVSQLGLVPTMTP